MAVRLLGVMARRVVLLSAFALVASLSWAGTTPPAEVATELPAARQQGSGKLSYFGLAIYEARLWAGEGFAADRYEQTPLAIEIEYARGLDGKAIAERSLTEMKRSGSISETQGERWLTTMQQTFPDVVKGDRITGVFRPGESARFFLNGQARGEVRDPEFARRFFGIWLSPKTSEPKLRQALIGTADAAVRASP